MRLSATWPALALLVGIVVPFVVLATTGSWVRALRAIDEFSTSLWLIVFAALWFQYRTAIRRADDGHRALEKEKKEQALMPTIERARAIAKTEGELAAMVRDAKPGLYWIEAGTFIAAAISGAARLILWMVPVGCA
jgi:hypothetical protein